MGFDLQVAHGYAPFPGDNHLRRLAEAGLGVIDLQQIRFNVLPASCRQFGTVRSELQPSSRMHAGPGTRSFRRDARSTLPNVLPASCRQFGTARSELQPSSRMHAALASVSSGETPAARCGERPFPKKKHRNRCRLRCFENPFAPARR